MKVLVTGASGFLGRYVLESLQRRGIETVVLGRRQAVGNASAQFIEADLLATADYATVLKQASATHLLHLAWYVEHGRYWTSPANLRWVEASTRLVEQFCAAGGQQVVLAGTCAEYDWSCGYHREDHTPLDPATLYGTAKDATRRLVMAICAQYQVTCSWGRVFLPFGKGEASQRLVPSLIEVFQGKRLPFEINLSAYRDFLHATDVAEGFITLLNRKAGGAYNISSGIPMQLGELVKTLAQLLNGDPRAVPGLTVERSGEPPLLVGENSKLKTLGWQPALSLMQGLEHTVREIQQ
jgi:nucleoside-diphosphate-sugar epimerase